MKKITDFCASLQFIFKPKYWVMLGKYDAELDRKIQQLAEQHDFVPLNVTSLNKDVAWVSLGSMHLWVGNYPYSFLVPVEVDNQVNLNDGNTLYFFKHRDSDGRPRPSRLTIHRLYNKLVADLKKHNTALYN